MNLARVSRWILVGLLSVALGCGTLLYPERRGVEDPGRIDPVVVLLDGALLLFFLVPGVVAFAVDIATGAIYEAEGSELTLRDGRDPLRVAAAEAGRLEIGLSTGRARREFGSVWWETEDGRRVATRIVAAADPARARLESRGELEPGAHRLVLTTADGAEHRVPMILLRDRESDRR